MQFIEKLVPDTSVIIEGLVSSKIKSKKLKTNQVIIHEAILSELEHQANLGKAIGFLGLDEIKRLRELKNIELIFSGQRPKAIEIRNASLGEIDSLIRQLAYEEDATLMTSDKVQAEVALARGIKCIYFKPESAIRKLKLEEYFDDTTMSVHLKENVVPYAKRGFPGSWEFTKLRDEPLKQEEVQEISREIIEDAKLRKDGFIEIEREGSTIVQLGKYRIVITKPPFSDGWEITAVRPIKRLILDDYKLSEKLKKRIAEQAEGILVAGSPGMGKSTFAQALAEYYASKNKTIKTVEAPRDLILPDTITQYAISHGDAQEIHDILLLSRPDYTIFDEMRNTEDFKLFADMRLAGVGMVGVVHATNPIDAIQRFIGRIEMGVIPQVIDTVVFIKNGQIEKVLSLKIVVKVPTGMTEADLARPVVVVNDFETNKLEYEIYTYGEQTVVVPVQQTPKTGVHKLAASSIEREFMRYCSNVKVELISDTKAIVYIPNKDIPKIIGRNGRKIETIERKLNIGIDIQPLERSRTEKEETRVIPFDIRIKKSSIIFTTNIENQNKDIGIYVNNEFLVRVKAGSTGTIKIKKNSPIGRTLVMAYNNGEDITLKAQ